jgi:hypothetical protein
MSFQNAIGVVAQFYRLWQVKAGVENLYRSYICTESHSPDFIISDKLFVAENQGLKWRDQRAVCVQDDVSLCEVLWESRP